MRPGSLLAEEHRIELAPEAKARSRYRMLPVDVPSGAAELRVEYKVEGESRVDLGLFDPRSGDGSLSGFRGWSGSARRSVTIQRRAATPGYIPGSVEPGRWQVILGFPHVSESSTVHLRVVASRKTSERLSRFEPSELDTARPWVREIPGVGSARPENPIAGEGWLRGDFHSHSVHSGDAEQPMSICQMVAGAEVRGLDFLAVTDHNTISHWPELAKAQKLTDLVLIAGEEVTTYRGHFNAFLARGLVDFRLTDESALEVCAREASSGGALLSINHPKSMGPRWDFPYLEFFGAVEAWQATWPWGNGESICYWDRLLDAGYEVVGIGGSDLHDMHARPFHQFGNPTTWVEVGKSRPRPDEIVMAARLGRVMVSATPVSPLPIVEFRDAGGWASAAGRKVECGSPLRVRVVGGGREGVLRLRGGGRVKWELDIEGTDEVIPIPAEAVAEVSEAPVAWFRAEIWMPGVFTTGPVATKTAEMVSFSNPVRISR